MMTEVMSTVQLDEAKSAKRANLTIIQESFLDDVETYLEEDEDKVIEKFEALRKECILITDQTDYSDQIGKIEN